MTTASTDLVLQPQMAALTERERLMPALRMEEAIERRHIIKEAVQRLMIEGQDYGEIPGTDKPTLLKPGAEKLCNLFGLVPTFDLIERTEDWDGADHAGEPFFYYLYKCRLSRQGGLIAEGDGSCNSRESKYRYRWVAEHNVPLHLDKARLPKRGGRITEFDFAIAKAETGGRYGKPAEYWQRFREAIEAGSAKETEREDRNKKKHKAWEIDGAEFRLANPDIADTVNTLIKMAQKRALVAATLIAVGASDFFTQDTEDSAGEVDTGGAERGTREAAQNVAAAKMSAMKSGQLDEIKRVLAEAYGEDRAKKSAIVEIIFGVRTWGALETISPEDLASGLGRLKDHILRENQPPLEAVTEDAGIILAQMVDIATTVGAFHVLKVRLEKAAGTETAGIEYRNVLGAAKVEHSNEFKGDLVAARRCWLSLYKVVVGYEKMQKQ